MKNNKTKTLVLVVLGIALIAVGAFQFLPKGGSSTTVATTSPKKQESPNKATTPLKHSEAAAVYVEPTTSGAAPVAGAPNGASETSSSAQGSTATSGNLAKNDEDPQKALVAQMVKDPLPQRDPFTPQVQPQTMTTPTPPTTPAQPVKSSAPRSGGYRPAPLGGGVKPWEPPLPSGGGLGTGSGPIGLTQGAPLRQPSEFAYTVKGVIVGKKPMAVFEDDNGNQRLVPLGGSLDGDSKVVGIEKGKVRIRHRGKEKTLDLPEGP